MTKPFKTLIESTPEMIEQIVNTAEQESIEEGEPAFSSEYREELRRELLAIYESEMAAEESTDDRVYIEPWIRFPDVFHSPEHFADQMQKGIDFKPPKLGSP